MPKTPEILHFYNPLKRGNHHDLGSQTWYTQNRYIYVCHQQVCVLARLLFGNAATKRSFNKIIKKLINVGVERGVATRMARVMRPMMIVTPTNFEGFTRRQF